MAHKTKPEVVERIEAAFEATAVARRSYIVNRAFLSGRQHVTWDSRLGDVTDIPAEDDRLRVTANRIWPASRVLMAALSRRPLQFQVMPDKADDASARASRLAEGILRTRVSDRGWERLRLDLLWGAWLGGTAGLAIDWDPASDRPLGMTETGRKYGTGDCVETAMTILDFAVEPGAIDAERAKWWARRESLPPKAVQARYSLKDEPSADSRSGRVPTTTDTTRQSPDPKLTTVTTYYERPCADSHGKVCVVVGDEVVEKGAWPFTFSDRLNLVVARETNVPGQWFGETVVTAAVPLQAAYNSAWSAVVDHTRKAGNARLLIPQSVVDMIDELTDDAGQSLAYPDGAEHPTWLSPPQLPSYVIETPKQIAAELDDLLGVHDVSRGDAPGRVDSALGLTILMESDNSPLGSAAAEVARAFGGLASRLLATYSAKVRDTRSQRAYSKPGQPAEQVRWSGKDLLGHTHAEVPVDALLPRSRSANNSLAMQMLQGGVVDPIGAAKLMELPGIEDLLSALSPQVAKAERENHKMLAGRQAVPADFDDQSHTDRHLSFMLSEQYELADAEVQGVINDHYRAHQSILSPDVPDVPGPLAMPPVDGLGPPSAQAGEAMPPDMPMPMPDEAMPPAMPMPGEAMPPPMPEQPGLTQAELIQQMLTENLI